VTTVVDHLLELVRIPSASSLSNRAVVDYAQEVLHHAQWSTTAHSYRDANGIEKINLIAAPPGQDSTASNVDLAFLCHTDTVPPAADWAAALAPFVRDGMLHGCGACDVKGFLACLLTAASEATPGSLKRVVRIVLTADEEIGCLGAHRLVAEDRLRARSLVIGEPTSLHAARAGKGYCLGEVTIFGAEAHSAHPQQGRSAIYDAARFLQAIERLAEELAAHRNDFFDPPYTTLNVGTIRGGSAKNIVPGECGFLLEWRPIPGQEPDLVPLAIERIGRELQQSDPAFRFAFKILRQQLGFETPGDASLVRAMEELTGRAPIAIPFASEASVFASLAEEIVVFGAGDMRTAHSPRECVPIAELHEAVRCIKALMQKG
jgi:acetylornithine deacetylase